MTFNWLNAFEGVVFVGVFVVPLCALAFFGAGRKRWGAAMIALFFLLVFLAGGIPWR